MSIVMEQKLGKRLSKCANQPMVKFNLSINQLSCFISQRPQSKNRHKSQPKSLSNPQPLIQVVRQHASDKKEPSSYFDFCFDHKVLFTKYGSREMYVDEEPNRAVSSQLNNASDLDDEPTEEVVNQCLRAITEDSTDNSAASSSSYSIAKYNEQQQFNEMNQFRYKMAAEQSLFSIRAGEVERDGRTTLMLRNIPNKYSQEMVLQQIEAAGLQEKYDFFYLPIDFKNDCNVGYAFINLIDVKFLPKLYESFHGKRWPRFNSEKICQVCYARIQGTSQLLNHFRFSNTLQRGNRSRPLIYLNIGLSGNKPNLDGVAKQYNSSTI